jgi:hypothetical protein
MLIISADLMSIEPCGDSTQFGWSLTTSGDFSRLKAKVIEAV